MNNQDSLRKQIIASMNRYTRSKGWADRTEVFNADMFENSILPVLDAAMKAGELLVHRATMPQKPVQEAIIEWLKGCLLVVGKIRSQEASASKRELLNVIYQFEDGATKALAEAGHHHLDRLWLSGKSLPAKTIPMKERLDYEYFSNTEKD